MSINYTEKGTGLHEAIRAAGLTLRQENGVWISSDDVAVQAVIDGYLLTDAKTAVSNAIDTYATLLRNKGAKTSSPAEMASWPTKLSEAAKYTSSSLASDAPNLSLEATQRGITLAALVAKVQTNADAVNQREAKIAGIAGKHKDNVKALGSFAAVNGYDFSSGWPTVP